LSICFNFVALCFYLSALSGCTFFSRHYSLDDALAACLQRDGGLAQRQHLRTTFQVRTSRRRCAKPLVVSSAFCQECCQFHSPHCRLALHCRYDTQFHHFVGLHFVVGTVLNSTTLSACNNSVWQGLKRREKVNKISCKRIALF